MISLTYPIGEKSIGGFQIDAYVVEAYSYENRVTNLTVEDGSNISEHVIEEPDRLSIEAFIGATKFEAFTGTRVREISDIEMPEDPKARIRQAHHELLRMKRSRQPLTVVTGLDALTDMVITSYNYHRDVDTGADLPFTMSFQKIRTVQSEETEISSLSAADGGVANIGNAGTSAVEEIGPYRQFWRQKVRMGEMSPANYYRQWGVPFPG